MQTSNLHKNESGKATVVAMSVSLCLIGIYALFGRSYLQASFPIIIDQIAFALLGVLSFFSLGFGFHMALVGDPSHKDVRKELRDRLVELGDFVDFTNDRIKEFESTSRFHIHAIRPIGLESLSQSRRIIQAMALRVNQVNVLLNSSHAIDLIEAEELISRDLELSENCVEALIGTNPIAPIPITECVPKVTGLLDRVAIEIERLQIAA